MSTWTREDHGSIAVLTYNQGNRNMLTRQGTTDLRDRLREIAEDRDVDVVMLTGGVDGYFIAHYDLGELAQMAKGEPIEGDPRSFGECEHLLTHMPQPTVVAIDGQAWGGGYEIALCCTIRLVSPRTSLALPEVSAGILPGGGGIQRLTRLIGAGRTAVRVLTGRPVDGATAVELGMADHLVEDDNFRDAAIEWCHLIARHPSNAIRLVKQALVDGLEVPLAQARQIDGELFMELNNSSEAQERNAAARANYDRQG